MYLDAKDTTVLLKHLKITHTSSETRKKILESKKPGCFFLHGCFGVKPKT